MLYNGPKFSYCAQFRQFQIKKWERRSFLTSDNLCTYRDLRRCSCCVVFVGKKDSISLVHCGLTWSSDACQVSFLIPIGSLVLVPACSTSVKKSDLSALNVTHRRFAQLPYEVFFPPDGYMK